MQTATEQPKRRKRRSVYELERSDLSDAITMRVNREALTRFKVICCAKGISYHKQMATLLLNWAKENSDVLSDYV